MIYSWVEGILFALPFCVSRAQLCSSHRRGRIRRRGRRQPQHTTDVM